MKRRRARMFVRVTVVTMSNSLTVSISGGSSREAISQTILGSSRYIGVLMASMTKTTVVRNPRSPSKKNDNTHVNSINRNRSFTPLRIVLVKIAQRSFNASTIEFENVGSVGSLSSILSYPLSERTEKKRNKAESL